MIVRIAFITDSIEQGHLVDPSDYLLEDAGMPRKRGRRRLPSPLHSRRSLEGRHELSEAQPSDTIVDAPSSILSRRRSATPEPPVAVQLTSGYKYTSAEMTYAWALIRRMISRDRGTSRLAAVKALHQKVCRARGSFEQYLLLLTPLVEDATSLHSFMVCPLNERERDVRRGQGGSPPFYHFF